MSKEAAKKPVPKKRQAINPAKRLTRREQSAIAALISKAKRKPKPGHEETAQQTIPYIQMFPDGLCRVTERYYTKTLQFWDINYQLAQIDDKKAMVEDWCNFLNSFDPSVRFQFTFINQTINVDDMKQSIYIPSRGDDFDDISTEYREFLIEQMAKGSNGLSKNKYLTFGIEADNFRTAKSRLERLELDIFNRFKPLGVKAASLNGAARLRVLHESLHLGETVPFNFSWKELPRNGMNTKDYIAPSSFEFNRDGRSFRMNQKYGAVSCVSLLAAGLGDRMLADLLDVEHNMIISMHMQIIDQATAIKMMKRYVSDVSKMKLDEQKKAIRAGYDPDILPPDLSTYCEDTTNSLKDLQNRDEHMFLLTFTIVNVADTPRALDNMIFQMSNLVQGHNCGMFRLDFQQEQGLTSALPLGLNRIDIQRNIFTSGLAMMIPFTTQELFQRSKGALYYGLNSLSNNLIMADRNLLKNPNGLILGTPGSGKSFSAKREITKPFPRPI